VSSSRRSALLGACCAALLFLAGSARATLPQLVLTPAAENLDQPVYVASTPADSGALYVVEKVGVIERVVNDVTDPTPFLDISKKVGTAEERGLLSMAFSPTYAQDGLYYIYYTDHGGTIHIAQCHKQGKKTKIKDLLRIKHPQFANHNGGQLQFGPDGDLYAGVGDGGSGGDPPNNAQNPTKLLGKLLRAAPPFKEWQIAAYGLRNPWRFSFNSANGDLWIGDVGQDTWEEVDYRSESDLPTQVNFGWSRWEGNHDYNTGIALTPTPGGYIGPVFEYDHATHNDCAVIGGYVYHGSGSPLMPDEVGRYFFTDLCTGQIRTLSAPGGVLSDERDENAPTVNQPVAFGVDASGELYVVSIGDGTVYRLSES
jgi:glucose/arabinose dehydrogenase